MGKLIRLLKHRSKLNEKMLIGRAEWCGLPELGLPAVKAKIDTGARTSALHAFNIKTVLRANKTYVTFCVHPLQGNNQFVVCAKARITDQRLIMSSNGHNEKRYVIETLINLGDATWLIEISLSNRDPLKYRMLLGRQALNSNVIIDPSRSLCQSRARVSELKAFYSEQ